MLFSRTNLVKKIVLSFLSAVILISVSLIFPSVINKGVALYSPAHTTGVLMDDTFMELFINDHNENPIFSLRKFTNVPLFTISKTFNISLTVSFLIVQFFYIFLTIFVFLSLIEQIYKKKFINSLITLLFFLFSFSIIFSFFIPIYSYDDFPQYLFLFLALFYGLKKKPILTTVFLSLSLLARESSILLFPSLAILIFPDIIENPKHFFTQKKELLKNLTLFIIPVIVYYLYVLIETILHKNILSANLDYFETERFSHLAFNFHNFQYGIESFMAILLVFLPTYYILSVSKTFQEDKNKKYLKMAWLLAFVINTPITLLATRAQEARIMALPMVLIWPFLGKYLYELLKEFPNEVKKYFKKWNSIDNIPVLIINFLLILTILFLAYLFLLKVYQPGLNGFPKGYKLYAIIITNVLTLHYLFTKKSE